jgi:hypothetical protein
LIYGYGVIIAAKRIQDEEEKKNKNRKKIKKYRIST